MIAGLASASTSAAFDSGANSRSVISSFELAWSSWKATMGASSRVLMVCSTAPSIGTP